VRLVTCNIWSGRGADGLVDPERLGRVLAGLDADVLALQEVDRDQDRSGGADLAAVVAQACGALHHRFAPALLGVPDGRWSVPHDGVDPGGPAYGVALVSRYPVTGWSVLPVPPLAGRVPYRWPGDRWPSTVRDEPRIALRATVATPFGAVTVVTTHLSFLPVSRTRQLRRLARALPREGPLVLLGDLNLGLRAAARATGLAAEPVGPTFPADSPVRQIDHLLRRGLPPPSYAAAVHTEVSDHRAVVADW
jgi:endonuclease/exonuclease/phosphatase family metal-dependent hydrolase